MTNYDMDASIRKMNLQREQDKDEEILNPKHYHHSGLGIEPLDYITANKMDFLQGNIIKYVTRFPFKGGVTDLIKAKKYLDLLIERERA